MRMAPGRRGRYCGADGMTSWGLGERLQAGWVDLSHSRGVLKSREFGSLIRAGGEGGNGQRAITRTRRGVVPYSYSVGVWLCVSNRVGRKMNDFRMNDEVDEQRDEMD